VLTYVDDATSRLQLLRFVEGESTLRYMQATKTYIEQYGKPVAFYSDKHTVFHINKRSAVGGNGMTQYGRALHELGIEIICANTPAAKGRVERALMVVSKIKYEGRELGYREFDKLTQTHQGEVVPHKRLGAMLTLISENQKLLPQEKRSMKCPTRRYPAPARLT
jgi:hypothetical protein